MAIPDNDLTSKILRAFFTVYNKHGYGFLEKVYHNSLKIELEELGLFCESNKKIFVYYKNKQVGHYFADLFIEGKVLLELKAVVEIHPSHYLQVLNYLKASETELGYLLNFGKNQHLKG